MPPASRRQVYVLSDSTGNLPRHMLAAFLTQFPPATFTVHDRPLLRTPEQVKQALPRCDAASGIVLHALLAPAAKATVAQHCEAAGIPHRDLTGSFVEFLAAASGVPAGEDVHRLHEMDEAYERRVRALEFTLEHDDGLGLDTLDDADVVLTGVSRTSKTPTSFYLAQQGLKVANVALAMAVAPPRQLLEMPAGKVVALVINPGVLAEIRTRRNHEWKMGGTAYNEAVAVEDEVRWSRRLFTRQGWPVIDVTNQAIEETAARVLAAIKPA